MTRSLRPLQQFFGTPPSPCPYLPRRLERKVVTGLGGADADLAYEALTVAGFRRSQSLVYKPACDGCEACIPVRVCAGLFRPRRNMRRVLSRNRDLRASELPPLAMSEHYALFRRYLVERHAEGGMASMGFAEYRAMVEDTPVDTLLIEYRREDGTLAGVSLTDRLRDGFSLIYSFFDPDEPWRSLGTYMVLWHIDRARALRLPHVYLGYWIEGCRKMSYKARFAPLEVLRREGWARIDLCEGLEEGGASALA